jgi:uncharacterized protein (DUF2235 family)
MEPAREGEKCPAGDIVVKEERRRHMSKKIVFCADGTWHTPQSRTNVYKIFRALLNTPGQVAYYDDGVGADGNPIEKLVGGAFGAGLFQKIKDATPKLPTSMKMAMRFFFSASVAVLIHPVALQE